MLLAPWLAHALLAAPALAPAWSFLPAGEGEKDEISLEDLLRRARAERAAQLETLRQPVRTLVQKLEATGQAGPTADGLRAEIRELGTDAGPLFVPWLDPGALPSQAERFRAAQIAQGLAAIASPAITEALIEMTLSGSLEGRLNAVRVLARSPDRARASERLAVLFGTAEGEVRRAALTSLAQQGGRENLELMRRALGDPDAEIVRSVLRASSLAHERDIGPAVIDILRSARTAAPVLPDALFYLQQCPEVVDDAAIETLVALADNAALAPAARVSILDALPAFHPSASKLKKPMEPLLQHADLKLREAAQICMVLVGDRSERRNLLKAYDSFVEENATWPKAYEQRGDVLLKIGDAGDAAKDFKRALELAKDAGDRELWIKLARAYARDGKLRQASDALASGSIPRSLLGPLAEDPDFRELAAHSRYGKVFGR